MLGALTQLRHVWRFEALRRVPLLCTLDPPTMAALAQALVSEQYKAGQDIIVEVWSRGSKVYYLLGFTRVCVTAARTCGEKDGTNHWGFLIRASGIESEKCNVLGMGGKLLITPVASIFPPLPDHPQGEIGDKLYIVEYGRLGVFQKQQQAASSPTASTTIVSGKQDAHLSAHISTGGAAITPGPAKDPQAGQQPLLTYQAGNYFGELALIRNELRAATVSTATAGVSGILPMHAHPPPFPPSRTTLLSHSWHPP